MWTVSPDSQDVALRYARRLVNEGARVGSLQAWLGSCFELRSAHALPDPLGTAAYLDCRSRKLHPELDDEPFLTDYVIPLVGEVIKVDTKCALPEARASLLVNKLSPEHAYVLGQVVRPNTDIELINRFRAFQMGGPALDLVVQPIGVMLGSLVKYWQTPAPELQVKAQHQANQLMHWDGFCALLVSRT